MVIYFAERDSYSFVFIRLDPLGKLCFNNIKQTRFDKELIHPVLDDAACGLVSTVDISVKHDYRLNKV